MGARRPKILIVDDEDNIVLAVHRVLYQDNDRYDVLLARTAEIAQQILTDVQIDVLVTDVHLPKQSGMDLLCWAAVETPQTRVIVMTAFDVTGIKDRAHAFGCLRLMRKPFDVHEMRAAILRALDRRDTVTGNLSELSCVDVIQMLCIARKTTALRLSEGSKSGIILIENGEIVHAIWETVSGEEAVFAMMEIKNGLFNTSPLPPDIDRTIKGDWQYLLIEGVRRIDDRAAGITRDGPDSSDAPRPSVRFAPFALPPPERVDGAGPPVVVPPPFTIGESRKAPPSVRPRASATASAGAPRSERPGPPSSPPPSLPPPPDPAKIEAARLIDLGFAALRSGNRDEARKFWEDALKLDPSSRMLELNIRKLSARNPYDR